MPGTILIVDDLATNRIALKSRLAAACYDTVQARDGTTGLRLAREEAPELILLDLALPDMPGTELCAKLKADPETRDIPVLMLTAEHDRAAPALALRAGADDFVTRPIDDAMLLARIRSLLRARETAEGLRLRDASLQEAAMAEAADGFFEAAECFDRAPARIAIVAAQRETAMAWRRALAPLVDAQFTICDRAGALDAQAPAPDVFVISADLEGPRDGLRLMSDLRARARTRRAAICIVLPPDAREAGPMALDLGASDLLEARFDPEETALRLSAQIKRKRQSERLRDQLRSGLRLAVTDPLTGLYNRRYAETHLARIAERARETGKRYAVMMLDLDRFKSINDTWGHAAGDAVLIEVARRLRDNIRAVDLLARLGGEEFIVAMPETRLGSARLAAERLCRVIEEEPVPLPGGVGAVTVTMSIGLALSDGTPEGGGSDSAERILDRADRALLAAKSAGRNKVNVGRCAA